jgi:hypothetical protein
MKTYSNTTDTEKHIIREYHNWKVSKCPTALKLEILTYWRNRATEKNITHLI